jgi:hypothetical protein
MSFPVSGLPEATTRRRTAVTRGRVLIALVVLGLAAAVAVPLSTMSRMGAGARPVTEAELTALGPGQTVDLALEVTRVTGESVTGESSFAATLLERAEQGGYRRTGRSLRVRWRPDTAVVMGGREEVRAGAVVQARGRVAGEDLVDAARLVVLTGYAAIR